MSFEVEGKLKRGDLIRVRRSLGYCHFGIYIGKDTVIHYSADKSDSIFDNTNIKVSKTNLEEGFLRGDILEVNTPYDSPFRRFKVCRRAKKLLGEHNFRGKPYDVLRNNCEHFATYCYYGEAKSDQSNHASEGLKGAFVELGVDIFNAIGKKYSESKKEVK